MAQLLGHRQLARDYQPISNPVQVVQIIAAAVAAAITTTQGLEIVAIQELWALEQTAILATTRLSSSWNS
jgi:hypothetical protein